MDELKKKIEAILFAIGRYISLEEIAGICKKEIQLVKNALLELQADYETNKDSSLVILNENDVWKLTTREEYGSIVRSIVSETELTKSQLETLAVIAFKYPIKQADLIKIRTNKAYEHLTELEKTGFITRQKYGRSRLIKLTDKFFEYFDLPKDKLKDRFKGFEQLASAIEGKEDEIEEIKKEQKKNAEETRIHEEKEKKLINGELEIDLIDDKGKKHELEIVDEPREEPRLEEIEEKLGNLEVIDEEPKKEKQNPEEIIPDEENPRVEMIKEVLVKKEEKRLKSVEEVLGKPEQKSEPEKEEKDETEEHDDEALIESEEQKKESPEEGIDLLEAEQSEEENKKGE